MNKIDHPEYGNEIYRLSDNAAMESFEEGALLLRLSDRRLYELNSTAQRILALCDGRTISQIAASLADEFDTPFDEVLKDLVEMLHQLASQGLVEKVEINPNNKEVKENE